MSPVFGANPAVAPSSESGSLLSSEPWAGPPSPLRPRRLPWAELLRRVHQVDVLRCPDCGGPIQVLAFLTDPTVTTAILECLGLPSAAPPLAPARAPPQRDLPFEDWEPHSPAHGRRIERTMSGPRRRSVRA